MKSPGTYSVLASGSTRRVATEVGWRILTIVLGIVTLGFIAVASFAIWDAYNTSDRQNALALKEQDDVNALTAADNALLSELLAVNASIYNQLAFLAAALNITNTNGNTFLQEIQQEIASSVSALNAAIDLRMVSVNNVDGDNATHNINLVPLPGITVTPHPLLNTVALGNSGVLSLVAGNAGLSFSAATGPLVAYNYGVLSLSGILPPSLDGNIEVLGVGMLSVYGNLNASTLTVDASLLVTAVSNLQTQVAAQQVEISDLQVNVTTLEEQITNIQLAEYVIQQALNGTETTINITLTELFSTVYAMQAEIAALQAALANQTQGTQIPTGTMNPWTGAPSTVPEGYLLCDGSEYLNTAYPALYTVIGTLYCEGNCSVGSFRVPAMGGRVPVGRGGGGLFQAAVGTEVGSETQTLSTPNLPSHSHTATTVSAGAHTHTAQSAEIGTLNVLIQHGDSSGNGFTGPYGGPPNGWNQCNELSLSIDNCGGFANYYDNTGNPYWMQRLDGAAANAAGQSWGNHQHTTDSQGSHTHTVNVANTGSGTAFNIAQPSIVVQYIIKT